MLEFLFLATFAFSVQQPVVPPIGHRCVVPSYGNHTINVPATSQSETYFVTGPPGFPGPKPLLVLFHGAFGDHDEHLNPTFWDGYDLIDRAVARGWYVVMHDGGFGPCSGSTAHAAYGNERFQRHTEAVIKDVMCRFKIEKEQVYGYGFSMGGFQALSYGARHRDPYSNEGFFAAVINHSGYFTIYQHFSAPLTNCGPINPCTYDGDYCSATWNWRRADILDLLPISCPGNTYVGTWPPTYSDVSYWNSQIQNLARTPIRTHHAVGEQNDCMIPMNELLEDWLVSVWPVAPILDVFNCISDPNCPVPPSIPPDCSPSAHLWSAVCAERALDWLDQSTRTGVMNAVSGVTGLLLIAEDNQRAYNYEVLRTNPNDFARVLSYTPEANALEFLFTSLPAYGSSVPNINRLTIYTNEVWSSLKTTDTVNWLEIRTNFPMAVRVRGYATPPTDVYLGGVPNAPYTYDPVAKTVEFSAGIGHQRWEIEP